MRISDGSSVVCSSDLRPVAIFGLHRGDAGERIRRVEGHFEGADARIDQGCADPKRLLRPDAAQDRADGRRALRQQVVEGHDGSPWGGWGCRSEEHTSELQSLMSISYAVLCLKTKKEVT